MRRSIVRFRPARLRTLQLSLGATFASFARETRAGFGGRSDGVGRWTHYRRREGGRPRGSGL